MLHRWGLCPLVDCGFLASAPLRLAPWRLAPGALAPLRLCASCASCVNTIPRSIVRTLRAGSGQLLQNGFGLNAKTQR